MKRHELDVASLVFGLIFAVIAVLWPLWKIDFIDWGQLTWAPAVALVGIGLLGVVLSITRSRRPADDLGPADEYAAPEDSVSVDEYETR